MHRNFQGTQSIKLVKDFHRILVVLFVLKFDQSSKRYEETHFATFRPIFSFCWNFKNHEKYKN